MRIPFITALAAGALALGGCAYGDLGMGLGYGDGYGGYGGYGYSPYSSGYYGGAYYGSSYGYSPYSSYGSPYGWYNNYYYPGTGYYVYDSYRRPYAMTTTQRQYWSTRSPALRTTTTTRTRVAPNWSGFTRTSTDRQQTRATRVQQRTDRQQARQERRDNR